jgi:2Fe-2S ferredoxin
MYTITYHFEQEGLEPVTLTHVEPRQSLLEVALMHHIALHHKCGGVCACTTCHVYIEAGGDHIEQPARREKDFINKAINPRPNSRLSCQCVLHEGTGELIITIPEQARLM